MVAAIAFVEGALVCQAGVQEAALVQEDLHPLAQEDLVDLEAFFEVHAEAKDLLVVLVPHSR